MNIDYRQIVIASFMFVSLGIFLASAIQGLALTNPQVPWYIGSIMDLAIYSIIPLCVYVGLFTRFNNPFKKRNELQNQTEVDSK